MNETHCSVHNIDADSVAWDTTMEVLHENDDYKTSFGSQVCPLCHVKALDKYRRARLEAKIQARQALQARQEAQEHARVVKAVVEAVKQVSGVDPMSLVGKEFSKPGLWGASPIKNIGVLENILPNLIVEAVRKAKG